MGKNDIQFNIGFTVDENGTLKANMAQLKAMAKETASLSQHTKTATKRKNDFNRAEKGAAELTSNSTKAFAKQAQTMSTGTVKAYATLAANIFAVTAAFNALSKAARVEQLAKGLEVIGNQGGRNLVKVAESLVAITDGAVSAEQAMRTVAVGTSAGFSTTQMERLTKVAKGASLALGRDMSDAMDRLIRGTAKLEPEILDELGIMVRLDDVVSKYAKSLGRTTSSISAYEKRMAFANAVTKQGEEKFGAIADSIDPNPYSQLSAAFQDLTNNGLNLINTVITPLISLIASSQGMILGVGTIFASTFASQMLPAIAEGAERMGNMAEELDKTSKASLDSVEANSSLTVAARDAINSLKSGTASADVYSTKLSKLTVALDNAQFSMTKSEKAGDTSSKKYLTMSKRVEVLKTAISGIKKGYGELYLSEARQTYSAALNSASQGKLFEAMKQTKAAVAAMNASILASNASSLKAVTGFKVLWGSLKAGGMYVRTLGTAFLGMLPVLGQIIVVGSLVYQAWQWLNQPTEAEKALKELESIVNRTAEVVSQLDKTLKYTKSSTSAFLAEIKAGSGQIKSFATAIEEVLSKPEAQSPELLALQDRLKRYEELYKRSGNDNLKSAIQDIKDQIKFWEDLGDIAPETLRELTIQTDKFIESIEKSPSLLSGMGKGYEQLLRIQTALSDKDVPLTRERLEKLVGELLSLAQVGDKITSSFSATKEAQSSYRNELENLIGVKSEFDGIVAASSARFTEFKSILSDTSLTADQLKKTFEGLLDSFSNEERLRVVEKGLLALGEAAKNASDSEVFLAGLGAIKAEWEVVRSTTQEYKNKAAAIEASADAYKEAMEVSPKALESFYKKQNEAINEHLLRVQAESKAYENIEGSKSKILKLQGDEIALNREKIKLEDELADKMQQLEQKLMQAKEAAENKEVSSSKNLLQNKLDILEVTEKIASYKMAEGLGRELTSVEEADRALKAFEAQKAIRLEIIEKERQHSLKSLEFEHQITQAELDRKYVLASGDIAAQNIIKATMDAEEAAYNNAVEGINNTAAIALLNIDEMEERLKQAFNFSVEEAALKRIEDIIEEISSIKFDNFNALEKLSTTSFEGLGDYADVAKSMNKALSTFQTVQKAKAELADNKALLASQKEALVAEEAAGHNVAKAKEALAKKSEELSDQENRSKTAATVAYANAASGTLLALAETQDQTSKRGFETAKAMQTGAAVINTAAAIMNALATVQPYPAALVAAGIAAATGAMQIATIANTKFGDSTAPSTPSSSGISVASSKGTGIAPTKGTVFGDPEAQSKSIENSMELMESIHAKEYRELRGINEGVKSLFNSFTGISRAITLGGGVGSFVTEGTTPPSYLKAIPNIGGLFSGVTKFMDKALGFVAESLFGGKKSVKIKKKGYEIGSIAISQLQQGIEASVQEFNYIRIKTSGGMFGSTKRKYKTIYGDADAQVVSLFNNVLDVLGDSVYSLTEGLGGSLEKALNYTFNVGQIDIKGLKPAEISEKVSGVINTQFDLAVDAVLGELIRKYQKFEEGIAETAIRLFASKTIVQDSFNKIGISLEGVNRPLKESQALFLDMANNIVELADGLEEYQKTFETFFDNFFSDSEKQMYRSQALNGIVQDIGVSLGSSREEYKEVLQSINLANEEGQRQYVQLLELSELASDYYAYIEDMEERKFELEIELLNSLGRVEHAVFKERVKQLKELSEAESIIQKQIWLSEDYNKAAERTQLLIDAENRLAEARSSTIDQIDELVRKLLGSKDSPVQAREFVEFEYNRLLDQATSATTAEELNRAISDLSNYIPEYLSFMGAFGGDYKTIFDSVLATLDSLKTTTISSSISSPTSLNSSDYLAIVNALDSLQLELTPERITQGFQALASGGLSSLQDSFIDSLGRGDLRKYYNDQISSIYYDKFNQVAPFEYITSLTDKLLGVLDRFNPAELWRMSNYLRAQPYEDIYATIPPFASGGFHRGGLRLVGEDGPELEVTGPSRIYSNSDTQQMLVDAIREAGAGNSNVEVKVYLGTKEIKDYHIEWHRNDQDVHAAVRREVK